MVTGGCWCLEVVGARAVGGGVRECERRELLAAACCCALLLAAVCYGCCVLCAGLGGG